MPGGNHASALTPQDRSRSLLAFVHQRLLAQPGDGPSLVDLLTELARAGGAEAAGLATLSADATLAVCQRVPLGGPPAPPARWPWEVQPDLLEHLRAAAAGLALQTPEGTNWLFAVSSLPGQGFGLLWLERPAAHNWEPAEGAALTLVGHALLRNSSAGAWGPQLEGALRQQRLEDVAGIVRRLAHDFGNVLTSILGFTELSLGQVPAGSPIHGYLREVHRGTEQGADLTARLRHFSRRGPAPQAATPLAVVLESEAERLRAAWGDAVRLQLLLPSELPPVRMDPELLRQTLLPVLENAREAIASEGTIIVTARATELGPAGCLDLLGNSRPGPCVELTVTDSGGGISPEARACLGEPFFTTKPRHRGLGLAVLYGLLHVHRGGFRLEPALGGGTTARLYLPVQPAGLAPPVAGTPTGTAGRGERVLVVDDDPLILQMVHTTLERAGYRVQAVGGGAEALAAFTAPADERFDLVLSDVFMPRLSGVDLARRLLHHDSDVNLLFMSGYVSAEFARENFGDWNFNLLQKPFRAEGLLHAVRTALDRGSRQLAVAARVPAPAAVPVPRARVNPRRTL
jgi:signal transduction histidine kinase/ActR/RegA family two-component response regulator